MHNVMKKYQINFKKNENLNYFQKCLNMRAANSNFMKVNLG